jgi:hypothetical protein
MFYEWLSNALRKTSTKFDEPSRGSLFTDDRVITISKLALFVGAKGFLWAPEGIYANIDLYRKMHSRHFMH